MSIGETLVDILILAISGFALAPTAQTNLPNVHSDGAANSKSRATPSSDPCQSDGQGAKQVEILSDTKGVDFGPYLIRLAPILRRNWYKLIPWSVEAPVLKRGKVVIEFLILKDGKIDLDGVTIQTSSGDTALDRAARGGIIRSDPLPRLPGEFTGQNVRLRISFYYNLSPDISISPCNDVRVPAGSTLQFSVGGKEVTNTSVTWSVLGPGCSGSACGTVSETGLYTAPLNIPIPPVVYVRARPRTGTSIEGQSKVTVVQANP